MLSEVIKVTTYQSTEIPGDFHILEAWLYKTQLLTSCSLRAASSASRLACTLCGPCSHKQLKHWQNQQSHTKTFVRIDLTERDFREWDDVTTA